MDNDTEVEVGEIVVSSSVFQIPSDKREEFFLRLEHFFGDFIIKSKELCSSTADVSPQMKSADEGRFHLLWQSRDEDAEIEALLANRNKRDSLT